VGEGEVNMSKGDEFKEQVQRYDHMWVKDHWGDGDDGSMQFRKCEHGDYVSYSDYEKLLNEKSPKQRGTFEDLLEVLKEKEKEIEKQVTYWLEKYQDGSYDIHNACVELGKCRDVSRIIYAIKDIEPELRFK